MCTCSMEGNTTEESAKMVCTGVIRALTANTEIRGMVRGEKKRSCRGEERRRGAAAEERKNELTH